MDDKIVENIINITLNAGHMIATGDINDIEVNKEFCNTIQKMAKTFEQQYNKEDDYYDAIDNFSERELIKLYGK